MSSHLRLSPVSGRALLFSFLSAFVSTLCFAQPATPAVSVHQGLPANYDWYQKTLYANGTYVILTLYPEEFFTSTDGANWSRITGPDLGFQQNSTVNADQQPDFTYGAGRWVVVSDSGKIFSSPDLVNWTRSTIGTTATLLTVNYVDSAFFAAGDSATLFSSPDGVTWTRLNIPGSNPTLEDFFRVDYGNGALVVCSTVPFNDGNPNNTGFSLEYSSDSGVAGPWEVDTLNSGSTIKYVKGRFYRNGPNGSYSSDARNWMPLSNADYYSDIFADSSLVYIVTQGSSFGAVLSSPDGINFGSPVNFPIYLSGGYYARGHYFVWLRDALESTDAVNWSVMGSYGPTAAYNGSTYVKVSPNQLSGYISSSPDFIHWTPADTVTTGLNQLVYDSTQFTAFGPTSYMSPPMAPAGRWAQARRWITLPRISIASMAAAPMWPGGSSPPPIRFGIHMMGSTGEDRHYRRPPNRNFSMATTPPLRRLPISNISMVSFGC